MAESLNRSPSLRAALGAWLRARSPQRNPAPAPLVVPGNATTLRGVLAAAGIPHDLSLETPPVERLPRIWLGAIAVLEHALRQVEAAGGLDTDAPELVLGAARRWALGEGAWEDYLGAVRLASDTLRDRPDWGYYGAAPLGAILEIGARKLQEPGELYGMERARDALERLRVPRREAEARLANVLRQALTTP